MATMVTLGKQLIEKTKRQWIEQGIAEGTITTAREMALAVVEARFGQVPEGLRNEIQRDLHLNELRDLHRAVVTAESLEKLADQHGYRLETSLGERWIREGFERGAIKSARVAVLAVLEEQLGQVPEGLREKLRVMEDLNELRELHRAALEGESLPG